MNTRTFIPCLLLVALAAPSALARAGDAWIVAPPDAVEGTTFTVEVHAAVDVQELGAAQFELRWDPAVLELDLGHGILGVGELGSGSVGILPVSAVNPLTPGLVIWNGFVLQPGHTGVLLLNTVGFRVLGAAGAATILDLTTTTLVSQTGAEIPVGSTFPRAGGSASVPIVAGPTFACGDVDASSAIDILDVLMTARAALGLIVLDAPTALRADVQGDGDVDILDALQIAYYSLGLPVALMCL
jgi:hypothetical protein